MNNTNNTADKVQEALELIPWFAIGKLSTDSQAFFEKALHANPSLKKQLKLEQQMIELVSADNTLLDKRAFALPEERLKSVLNVIDGIHNQTTIKEKSALERFKSSLNSLIPSSDFKPQFAQFASITLVVLSVAALSSFMTQSKTVSSDFTPASAKSQPLVDESSIIDATKSVLLIGFNGSLDELRNNSVLKGKQMTISNPEDNNGFFQVTFEGSMTEEEIKQTINALSAQEDKVWFAGEGF